MLVFPASSASELCCRGARPAGAAPGGVLEGRGLVAVIKRQVPLAGQLRHDLSWGQGWGWVTLPNGAWSGRHRYERECVNNQNNLSRLLVTRVVGQEGSSCSKHCTCAVKFTMKPDVVAGRRGLRPALPTMHHTNVSQACSMLDGVTAYEASVYEQALADYDDSAAASDDWDFGVDCGDFMM
ncbi:hypothetical protein EVAR_98450_1 [Eumeta japonica]|uniref:Uncharacterized protein n=1 Tax=Eumeta variegata TaxID=151549 RepID=A0A4C1YTN5_EUMVA|nr:hypothetical protein EVAR_98450_1 [Eumeta japonica]